ncbi:MAG: hypothetical protein P9L97_08320 [Candidatus Tenebribacter davisii]|nr:hypothetical protein [Candidatus Tenebribacter davisii]
MFQIFAEKIITGLAAFSMLLLSSYQGNDAAFSNFSRSFIDDKIFMECRLENAFDNDFEEIFKSGQNIDVFFKIKIELNDQLIHEEEFKHTIIFDPLSQSFNIMLEDQDLTSTTGSFLELTNIISNVEYSYENENIHDCTLTMNAYLPKIRLETLNRDFDLMMLWKFNEPKFTIELAEDNNET